MISEELLTAEFCMGCIYFNPDGRNDQKRCSRLSGPKIGTGKDGKKFCIVKDADGVMWVR